MRKEALQTLVGGQPGNRWSITSSKRVSYLGTEAATDFALEPMEGGHIA
jgi:hypothetical protein